MLYYTIQELVSDGILSGKNNDVLYIGFRHEYALYVNKPSRVTCRDVLSYREISNMGGWDSTMKADKFCDKCMDYNLQYSTLTECPHKNCIPCLRHIGRVLDQQGHYQFTCGNYKCKATHHRAHYKEAMEIPKRSEWECDESGEDAVDDDAMDMQANLQDVEIAKGDVSSTPAVNVTEDVSSTPAENVTDAGSIVPPTVETQTGKKGNARKVPKARNVQVDEVTSPVHCT